MTNHYSDTWFETFLSPESAAPVDREVRFIKSHLSRGAYPRLLDLACGIGRHANALAAEGYEVVGIDRSARAVAAARDARQPRAEFRVLDMARLSSIEGVFDGVLCLWQSFGYGNEYENAALLADMGRLLRPGGRLLLDVYNRDALDGLDRETVEVRAGREVVTCRRRAGRRLEVGIRYGGTEEEDRFDWLVYTPGELTECAEACGLATVLSCAWFEAETLPSPDHLRMQLLFERAAR